MSPQHGFYYDQTRCSGCKACIVACQDWNSVAPGPAVWRKVTHIEQGKFPDARSFNLSMACNHCEDPACLPVCPVDAIYKRDEDGVVLVDRTICIECHECERACPFGAPQFGDDDSEPVPGEDWEEAHPMQKCTSCWDRREVGLAPACVGACLQRALDFGPLEELQKKYEKTVKTVLGLPADDVSMEGEKIDPTVPSFIFKQKA